MSRYSNDEDDCDMCDHPDRDYEDNESMIDLGGGMIVPLKELLDDDHGD